MKKLLLATAISSAMGFSAMATAAEYTLDTDGAHAAINFKVSHLGYSFITGRFDKFDGKFSYDADNVEASKISVNVDTRSMDSNHAERDKHLTGSRFIDAGKFSTAKFVSSSITKKADGGLAVKGDMTLHGQTKSIVIDAHFIGEGKDPWGGYRAGFQGTTRLQLADFGIPVVGKSSYVDLDLQVEGIRQ